MVVVVILDLVWGPRRSFCGLVCACGIVGLLVCNLSGGSKVWFEAVVFIRTLSGDSGLNIFRLLEQVFPFH